MASALLSFEILALRWGFFVLMICCGLALYLEDLQSIQLIMFVSSSAVRSQALDARMLYLNRIAAGRWRGGAVTRFLLKSRLRIARLSACNLPREANNLTLLLLVLHGVSYFDSRVIELEPLGDGLFTAGFEEFGGKFK